MYIHVKYQESDYYDVIDVETGVKIPLVQWADDEIGEFAIVLYDFANKKFVVDLNNNLIEFTIKRPIKIVKKE